jgi:hypothetical protein
MTSISNLSLSGLSKYLDELKNRMSADIPTTNVPTSLIKIVLKGKFNQKPLIKPKP